MQKPRRVAEAGLEALAIPENRKRSRGLHDLPTRSSSPGSIPGRPESGFIPLAPDLDFALAGFNQSLSAAWSGTLKVNCPPCGEVHEISVREVYINGAIEDASERLRRV